MFAAVIPRSQIETFAREVARLFRPEKIVLFGSYAGGTPTEDSDADLLVIMPHEGHSAVQAARIRQRIRGGFPMDLIVRSPQTVSERLAQGDCFLQEILERGETLYEAEHAGVG